jgi:hypothetical protein
MGGLLSVIDRARRNDCDHPRVRKLFYQTKADYSSHRESDGLKAPWCSKWTRAQVIAGQSLTKNSDFVGVDAQDAGYNNGR